MVESVQRIAPASSATEGRRYGIYLVAGVVVTSLARIVIEIGWLLPAPVGDSSYFLTASANYCRSGFLGTTAFPIDPTGHARMIWHGFVSPMLFGAANMSCAPAGYYAILGVIQLLTVAGTILLARRRQFPAINIYALAAFALAVQSGALFRPESLGLLCIAVAELAFEYDLAIVLGAALTALFCTQPTLAGLYGLYFLLARFAWLRSRVLRGSVAAAVTFVLLFTWYPFTMTDLAKGILLQARLLQSRSDGGLWSYYVLSPFLPLWGILFVAAWVLATLKNRLLILLAPAFWYFGPRLPPTSYNLIPICWLLLMQVSSEAPRKIARLLGGATIAVAVLGLAAMTTRDLLTIAHYGDTFLDTREKVRALAARSTIAESVPPFVALTNPELGVTNPHTARSLRNKGIDSISLFAVSGRPLSPCGTDDDDPVSLSIGHWILFRSNSGWMVYVCRGSALSNG